MDSNVLFPVLTINKIGQANFSFGYLDWLWCVRCKEGHYFK